MLLKGKRAWASGLGKGERTWSCQRRIVKRVPLKGSKGILFALLSLKEAIIVQLTKQSPTWREHIMKGLREGCECVLSGELSVC